MRVRSQGDTVLPYPEPPFEGKIERLVTDSVPDFPEAVEPLAGAVQECKRRKDPEPRGEFRVALLDFGSAAWLCFPKCQTQTE